MYRSGPCSLVVPQLVFQRPAWMFGCAERRIFTCPVTCPALVPPSSVLWVAVSWGLGCGEVKLRSGKQTLCFCTNMSASPKESGGELPFIVILYYTSLSCTYSWNLWRRKGRSNPV